MKQFTKAELAEFNGLDGKPCYIAYKGKVYEVTDNANFSDGSHYSHPTGEDLTKVLDEAPHSAEVFNSLTIVGELKQ
jgi:predicted heme/steroid binding protein